MITRCVLLACCAVLLAATVAMGTPGTVMTRDGQKFVGDVTERTDDVVVNVKGVETIILRGNIESITYSESFDKEFATRMAALAPDDVPGRIALARWAFDQQQYEKARDALHSALAIDPNSREASDMLNLVRGQMRLEQAKPSDGSSSGSAPKAHSPGPPNPLSPVERKLISTADINVIRQRELKSGDNVNIRFEKNVVKRFTDYDNRNFSEFNALGKTEQALVIFEKGDPSMQEDVRIMSDPPAVLEFRQKIQPLVLNGCASLQCHGGPQGGNFVLFSPADNDAITYTNFYILMQYRKKVEGNDTGVFGGQQERSMVDRGNAVRSLLVQYGLPADLAEIEHPHVMGYVGIFRSREDPKYRMVVRWMNESLAPLAKDYNIRYELPTRPEKAAPSTRPSR